MSAENDSGDLGLSINPPAVRFYTRRILWAVAVPALLLPGTMTSVMEEAWAGDGGSPSVTMAIQTTKPIPLEAINAVENNEWKTAVKALQAYIKSEPGSAEAHYLLGKSLFNPKRFSEAKEELRKALRLGKGDNFSARANEMLVQMPKSMVVPRQIHPAAVMGQAKD
jgi:cytochrome c-type biogenesis protein CcmH/NrfG